MSSSHETEALFVHQPPMRVYDVIQRLGSQLSGFGCKTEGRRASRALRFLSILRESMIGRIPAIKGEAGSTQFSTNQMRD